MLSSKGLQPKLWRDLSEAKGYAERRSAAECHAAATIASLLEEIEACKQRIPFGRCYRRYQVRAECSDSRLQALRTARVAASMVKLATASDSGLEAIISMYTLNASQGSNKQSRSDLQKLGAESIMMAHLRAASAFAMAGQGARCMAWCDKGQHIDLRQYGLDTAKSRSISIRLQTSLAALSLRECINLAWESDHITSGRGRAPGNHTVIQARRGRSYKRPSSFLNRKVDVAYIKRPQPTIVAGPRASAVTYGREQHRTDSMSMVIQCTQQVLELLSVAIPGDSTAVAMWPMRLPVWWKQGDAGEAWHPSYRLRPRSRSRSPPGHSVASGSVPPPGYNHCRQKATCSSLSLLHRQEISGSQDGRGRDRGRAACVAESGTASGVVSRPTSRSKEIDATEIYGKLKQEQQSAAEMQRALLGCQGAVDSLDTNGTMLAVQAILDHAIGLDSVAWLVEGIRGIALLRPLRIQCLHALALRCSERHSRTCELVHVVRELGAELALLGDYDAGCQLLVCVLQHAGDTRRRQAQRLVASQTRFRCSTFTDTRGLDSIPAEGDMCNVSKSGIQMQGHLGPVTLGWSRSSRIMAAARQIESDERARAAVAIRAANLGLVSPSVPSSSPPGPRPSPPISSVGAPLHGGKTDSLYGALRPIRLDHLQPGGCASYESTQCQSTWMRPSKERMDLVNAPLHPTATHADRVAHVGDPVAVTAGGARTPNGPSLHAREQAAEAAAFRTGLGMRLLSIKEYTAASSRAYLAPGQRAADVRLSPLQAGSSSLMATRLRTDSALVLRSRHSDTRVRLLPDAQREAERKLIQSALLDTGEYKINRGGTQLLDGIRRSIQVGPSRQKERRGFGRSSYRFRYLDLDTERE